MASSAKGLRLLKALEAVKKRPTLDAKIISKTTLLSASDGVLKGSFTVEPSMCNLGGTLHGGFFASIIDVFSFYSQLSHKDGRVSWTTTMNINFIAAATKGETVNVETRLLKSGSASIVETYLHNGKGNLLAKGTATFMAGEEKYQHLFKDLVGFDVFEEN